MTDLALPTAIFKRLEDLARAENRTPSEIVEQLLVAYFAEHEAATIGDMTIEDAPPVDSSFFTRSTMKLIETQQWQGNSRLR